MTLRRQVKGQRAALTRLKDFRIFTDTEHGSQFWYNYLTTNNFALHYFFQVSPQWCSSNQNDELLDAS